MKSQFLLISAIALIAVNLYGFPALAQIEQNCQQNQEVFKFQMLNYLMKHQEGAGAILNINVTYRLTPEAIAANKYPDFVPIKKDIDDFLVKYPNQSDYWEIVNRNLVQFILGKYPQMASLQITMNVMPNVANKPFTPRASIVKNTRPGSCPLIFSE
jgi:hypothetical protein